MERFGVFQAGRIAQVYSLGTNKWALLLYGMPKTRTPQSCKPYALKPQNPKLDPDPLQSLGGKGPRFHSEGSV